MHPFEIGFSFFLSFTTCNTESNSLFWRVLTAFQPHFFLFLFCPTSGQANEEAYALFPVALVRDSNHVSPCHVPGPSPEPNTLTTIKTPGQALKPLLGLLGKPA